MEDVEEERQDMHKPVSRTNLTVNEIIEMKTYCNGSCMIKKRGFEKVYKGNLRGRCVVIKKMERRSEDSMALVEKEVRVLQGKHHKNLVGLIAWCIEEEVFYLVYELVNGCTLEGRLRNEPRACLRWKECLKIIQGIAEGIKFLHSNKIIHADIKPQNLMQDSTDGEVKIFDCGSSIHVHGKERSRFGERVMDTSEYSAPEYRFNGQISYEQDVWGFGIVALEVITGQKYIDHARSDFHYIHDYVEDMMENNRFEEAVKERIIHDRWDEYDVKSAMVVAELAVSCIRYYKQKRPSIYSVVESLDRAKEQMSTNLAENEIIEMKSYCKDSCIIGKGGLGTVYRGNLRGGCVAIKKMERTTDDSMALVENEVRLLQEKHHKNVVGLIAWCIEKEVFYLVYEHVNGCTLEWRLRNEERACLGWKECLKIIQGIAEGIQYLHSNKIIHADIKPQNLMQDSTDEEVKILDFGTSRHVDWKETHRITDRVMGTKGYWPPEYSWKSEVSYKIDVYSFGIVVLEVITGQKCVDQARAATQFHIPDYVKYMMLKKQFKEAVKERINYDGWDKQDVSRAMDVARLALWCADEDKKERPNMDLVVELITAEKKLQTWLNHRALRQCFSKCFL